MDNAQDPVKHHRPQRAVPKAEQFMHLVYFALVTVHGPYHLAAAACFVLGVVIIIFHLEGE